MKQAFSFAVSRSAVNSRPLSARISNASTAAACATAFECVEFGLKGVHIDNVHGINGKTPEDTMRNMGLIASPGMVLTEKTIVEIQESKLK